MKTEEVTTRVDELRILAHHMPREAVVGRVLELVHEITGVNLVPALPDPEPAPAPVLRVDVVDLTAAIRDQASPERENEAAGVMGPHKAGDLLEELLRPPDEAGVAGAEPVDVEALMEGWERGEEEPPPQEAEPYSNASQGPPAKEWPAQQTEPGPEPERGEKTCNLCGETKPLDEFYANSSYKDGYTNFCKSCNRERTREAARRRKEEASAAADARVAEPAPEPDPGPVGITKVTRLPRQEQPSPASTEKRSAAPREKRERLCENGGDCVSVPHTGRPTKLNSRNTTGVCFHCEEKERETTLGRRPRTGGTIVRKSGGDR